MMLTARRVALAFLAPCWLSLADAQENQVVMKLDAWADVDNIVHVRWVTDPPTKGRVEYGPAPELGSVVGEDPDALRGTTNNRDSGIGWASNHRADIAGLEQWPVHVRVAGETREGESFQTETIAVPAPVQPAGGAERATIPITVAPGDWKVERLPITVGVPFPQGALGSADHVRVLSGGEEVPSAAVGLHR